VAGAGVAPVQVAGGVRTHVSKAEPSGSDLCRIAQL